MKNTRYYLIALFLIPILGAQASSHPGNWFFGESVGITAPKLTDKHLIDEGGGWPDDSYVTHSIQKTPYFSLFAGYRWNNETTWLPFYSLSANYTHAIKASIKGNLLQFGVPQFENYTYEYSLKREALWGTLKGDLFRYQNVMPFITLSVGGALNRVGDYYEMAMPGILPRLSPDFQNKTSLNFSYALGAGIDYVLFQNLWVSLEYQYGFFGQANSGAGLGLFATSELKTKLKAKGLNLKASYFLDKA